MAQESYYYMTGGDTIETSSEIHWSSPFFFGTPYGYQLDLDLKFVDDSKQSDTIRRLAFNRRPRANPASVPQSVVDQCHRASSEPVSSVSSDEARNLSVTTSSSSSSSSSSINRRRPPLPPSYSAPKSTSEGPVHSQVPPTCLGPSDGKPPLATRQTAASKPNPLVERTLVETRRRLEQEKALPETLPPEPYPRRRLASFGGIGSSGSLSPYTSWSALNQVSHKGSKLTVPDSGAKCVGISPLSSGRATPVPGVSSQHLQMVRDQMVVALERLKELEEQVKSVPLLQVKISVLQEEKRQLFALLNNQDGQNLGSHQDLDLQKLCRERSHSTGSSLQFLQQNTKSGKVDKEGKFSEEVDGWENSSSSGLEEFKQLGAEMELLEKKIQDARLAAQQTSISRAKGPKSVSTSDDSFLTRDHSFLMASSRDIAVETRVETRSTAVGVSEVMLGVVNDSESELEMQQQTIQVLRDSVQMLEAELKEALLKAEMWRLRCELREAGARNRADKSCIARPEFQSTAVQTIPQTRTLGVGNHTQFADAAVGEGALLSLHAVGVTCRPVTKGVSCGPDIHMEMWEVRKRVEKRDQCVGKNYLLTCCQGVGTNVSVRDVGVVTLESMETLCKKKVSSRSVGCGDCTIDANVNVVKPLVSQGMVTDPVRGIDLGGLATPWTSSQHTNSAISTVSRCTSTSQTYVSEFGTNTTDIPTQERHTNTSQVITRTLAIGDGTVTERKTPVKVRSIAVGTTYMKEGSTIPATTKAKTRDTGVGLANVNENFLVGLRMKNIACGPSRLPDPVKTRSIGVEVGDGRIRDPDGRVQPLQPYLFAQSEPGLDHYIDRMQKLLKEQQCLLTDSPYETIEEQDYLQPMDHPDVQHGVTKHNSSMKPSESRDLQTKTQQKQRMSSDLNRSPGGDDSLRSVTKRKDIIQRSAESRKTLRSLSPRFERVSVNDNSSSEGTDLQDEKKKSKWEAQRGDSLRNSTSPSRMERRERYEMSEKVLSACHSLKTHLNDSQALSNRELHSCLNVVQQEWFRVSSQKTVCPDAVDDFLCACRRVSPAVRTHVANMADRNGNTALHYSVSHSNFSVVRKLLDAGVCDVNKQNKAGYTPIMLAALAAVENQEDMKVVEELFRKGDVNAKAIQAGQTALMLAVSHGRMDMVKVLLSCGTKTNLQDDEGSTALMCASEHGHTDIVKLLLAQPGCDATLRDNDDSTALSIALEAGHKDIAMLLYAHVNYGKGQAMGAPRSRTPPAVAGKVCFD